MTGVVVTAAEVGENVSLLAARRLEVYAATIRQNLAAVRRLRAFHGQFLLAESRVLQDLMAHVRAMEEQLRQEIHRLHEDGITAPGGAEIEAGFQNVLADIGEMTSLLAASGPDLGSEMGRDELRDVRGKVAGTTTAVAEAEAVVVPVDQPCGCTDTLRTQ